MPGAAGVPRAKGGVRGAGGGAGTLGVRCPRNRLAARGASPGGSWGWRVSRDPGERGDLGGAPRQQLRAPPGTCSR